jgi:hypothetical protein
VYPVLCKTTGDEGNRAILRAQAEGREMTLVHRPDNQLYQHGVQWRVVFL